MSETGAAPYREGQARKHPAPLLALCIVFILFGVLGTCAGISGIGSLAMQGTMTEWMSQLPTAGAGPQMDDIMAITQKWMPLSVTMIVVNLAFAVTLIIGASMTLAWNPSARRLLIGILATGIALTVLVTVGEVVMQQIIMRETQALMQAQMAQVGAAGFDAMMQGQSILAGCIPITWAVIKIGLFAGGIFYFNSPDVKRLWGHA